mgnify:CR=1 FL=1
MHYSGVRRGVFVERPNRFIAHAELDGQPVVCHVKNTGRCRELLTPGAVIYLQESDNPNRKTRYDLIAVEKGGLLINMDAQAPNQVFREWAEGGGFLPGLSLLRPETAWGKSRFDFYWELSTGRRGFVEVKGVKLLATKVADVDMNGLRNLGDQLKEKMGGGVVVIVSTTNDKANVIVMADNDAISKGAHAGNMIKEIAKCVGGGGGGRPNMAQAGGKNPAGIDELLKKAPEVLAEQINA